MIYIKMDLALNNLQRLICHKTQQTKQNPIVNDRRNEAKEKEMRASILQHF